MKKFLLNYKILLTLILLIFIMIINFNKIRGYVRSNMPHDYKVFIKEIFFGKEYLEEISFYRKLGYNKFQIPKTQFVDLEFKKISLKGLKSFKSHYNMAFNKKGKTKKFFLEDLGNGILIASASGEFKFSTDYSLSKFEDINTNLSELDVFQVVDITKLENDIFISFVIKSENDECVFFGIANANLNKKKLLFNLFYKENQCTKETNGLGGSIPLYFSGKKRFFTYNCCH